MKQSAAPAIPADIQAAVTRILEYMYDDEQENYEERDEEEDDEEEASNHIFLSLQALAKWTGWEAE